MAKGKTSNKHQKDLYSRYKAENKHSKNKIRRMKTHMKNHPNDEQTAKVLKGEKVVYNRNKHGDNQGASKQDLENNRLKSIGKRKVYDSKGFVLKFRSKQVSHVKSVREQFNDLGIYRGRDFHNKVA